MLSGDFYPTDLVVFFPRDLVSRDDLPFFICPYPQLGVHLLLGYYFAFEYMPHQQVVIHGLRDNLCDS